MSTTIARVRRGRVAAHGIALAGTAAIAAIAAPLAAGATYAARDGASLVAAVASANSQSAPSRINLSAGAYTPDQTLTIRGDITIAGPSGPGEKLAGTAVTPLESPLFVVSAGAHATLVNVLVTNAGYPGAVPAIDVFGAVDLENSTLAGNPGPALTVEPGASATIRNSTLSDGLAAGLVDHGSAALFDSTIAANKHIGVDARDGTLTLVNTIVAGNGMSDCTAPAAASDHSLDGDGSCGVGALSRADPKLGRLLLSNGGPTPTRALEPGSAALDAGNPARCPGEDQRHYARSDGRCDIGAYEAAASGGGASPVGGGSGNQPPATGPGSVRRDLVGVSGHGSLAGPKGSRITFTVRARVTRPHGSFVYHDAARGVWVKALSVVSVVIDPVRRTATIKGRAVDLLRRRRESFTAVVSDHAGTRGLRIRLASGYGGGGRLLRGSIALTGARGAGARAGNPGSRS